MKLKDTESKTEFYPDVIVQTEGHHGHVVEGAYILKCQLVARDKGGLSVMQCVQQMRKQAAALSRACSEWLGDDLEQRRGGS